MYDAINELQDAFANQTGVWFGNLEPLAMQLLLVLAGIGLVWKFIEIVMQGGRAELGDVLFALVQKVLVVGWWLAWIRFAPEWSRVMAEGGLAAANVATGATIQLNPGGAFAFGVELAGRLIDAAEWDTLVFVGLVAILVVVVYAMLAALVVQTYAEFYITSAAGSLFLGLGGLQQTEGIAVRYIFALLGLSVRLFAIYLVLGIGEQMIESWVIAQGELTSARQVLTLLGVVAIVFFVAMIVPAAMQQIAGGGSVSALGPMAMMQGTMSMAGGLAGAALKGGAAVQAAGGLSAAQMGAGSVGQAIRGAMANAPSGPGSMAPSAGSQAAAGLGAAGEVAGRTAKNLAAGLFGNVTGQLLGQGSTAGMIHAMRESMLQGLPLGSGSAAGVEGAVAPGGDGPPDRGSRYLGQGGE